MSTPLSIVFAGTPVFAQRHLEALLESTHRVVGVLTQPDRPAGRGKKTAALSCKNAGAGRTTTPVTTPVSAANRRPGRYRGLGARRHGRGSLRLTASPPRCSTSRNMAVSMSTARCSRDGAVQRRSNGPLRQGMMKPGSLSCKWTKGSIPEMFWPARLSR